MKEFIEQEPYPLMRIITFGEFALERLVPSNAAGGPCYAPVLPEEWGNRGPAITLLKVLLCRAQRRASREELIATIWPDHGAINAVHALDSAASILRRRILRTATGDSLLSTLRSGGETIFKLPTQRQLWTDADALLALAAQSLQITNREQNLLALLESAHMLVNGEFLEDDLDQTWAQRRRHTINGARRRVLYKLVELYLKEQRISQTEELLYTFLEENPTDEDALCRLMTLLAKQERRQEALQLYHYTVDILREEQGSPAFYTRDLAARIQRGLAIREQMTDYVTTSTATLSTGRQVRKKTYCMTRPCTKRAAMLIVGLYLHYVSIRRWYAMRIETDKLYYGNYKFVVELDTGAETGSNQLTVWFAEKVNVQSFPLSHFKTGQLFKALREPYKSCLHAQLQEEQCACRKPFEEEIATLQQPFPIVPATMKHKLPGQIKRQTHNLRKQMDIALQRIQTDFTHRVLLSQDRDYFDYAILQQESRNFGDERFLRDFYFTETDTNHIRRFCRKFALDEAYRQQVLAKDVPWAKRNALFLRNLFSIFKNDAYALNASDYEHLLSDFFGWINKHFEAIISLPAYKQLQQSDNTCQMSLQEPDMLIQPAIAMFSHTPGIMIRASCQGISGKVCFQGREVIAVSEHEEYAYVSFSAIDPLIMKAIEALLPDFPDITNIPIPGNFALWPVLRSTGNNIRFRTELTALAERIRARVGHLSPP